MKQAKVFVTMDISGSMGTRKKNKAKEYYLNFKSLLDNVYESIETVFIAHTTVARFSNEEEMFISGESGGTFLSSGLELVKQSKLCDGDNFLIIFSDGDNWGEDNDLFINSVNDLLNSFTNIFYVEVKSATYVSSVLERLYKIENKNLDLKMINPYDDNNDFLCELQDILRFFDKMKII